MHPSAFLHRSSLGYVYLSDKYNYWRNAVYYMQTTTSQGNWISWPAAECMVLLFQFAVVFSPVSICCGAFLLFQFAAVLSLVSDSCASPNAPQLTALQPPSEQPPRDRITGRVRGPNLKNTTIVKINLPDTG